jgi:hypothetical protein
MKTKVKLAILIIIGLFLTILFYNFPAPHERMLNIQNYLITVGGIISAFVIAYLSAKFFNIKTDRDNRQIEINKLAERLTAFRKIIYFVMESRNFWTNYSDIPKFKKLYPGLNYERLRYTERDELRYKYHDEWESTKLSEGTISLFTAMEVLYEDDGFMPWAYNKTASFKYSIEDLVKFHEPTNQIWYYLDGRYVKHGKGLFDENGFSPLFKENFRELLPLADLKHKGKDIDRLTLASLGSEFYEYVIPRMHELVTENTGIPKGLLKTFYSLIAIMVFGVLFPITLQSLLVSDNVDSFFTLLFVVLTILSIIHFFLDFFDLLKEELHPNKSNH